MSTRWIKDNPPSDRLPFWTRANVGEVLPEPPSPLGWDIVWEHGTILGWRDCAVGRLGFAEDELSEVRPEVMGLFGGYAYLNASLNRVFGYRAPGLTASTVDDIYFGDHPDVPPVVVDDWWDSPRATAELEHWLGWVVTTTEQPDLERDREIADAARVGRPDFTSMSNGELITFATSHVPTIRRMFDQHIHQSAGATIGPGIIAAVAEAVGDPTLTLKIIGAVGDVDSAAPSYAMWTLSRAVADSAALTAAFDDGVTGLIGRLREIDDPAAATFLADLDDFMFRFGSRGPNEWDIHAPVWETKPELVLSAIDRMRFAGDDESPERRHAAREQERDAIVTQLTEALAGDPEAQGQFLAGVASAARFVAGRERSKTSIIKVVHECRLAVWELGRRLVELGGAGEARDVCMLFLDEIDRAMAEPTWAHQTITERQAHYDHLQGLEPPFIFNGECPPADTWRRKGSNPVEVLAPGGTVQGAPGSSGTYRGTARVVLDPGDPTALDPGDVLVAPHTDPAWTPLFVTAGAVVVDVGATLSHAIIVSRELGLPCVVSAKDATRMIPDGALVEVDGDTGVVTVLAG
jgi:phosphohistidine swiveling domain-containing protein